MNAVSDADARPCYVIDTTVSRFTVQAFAGGILSALGHNPKFVARDFTGEVSFDPNVPNGASLTMNLRPSSLTLADDVSDSDRRTMERTMHDDVLEDSKYTEIVYRCPKASARPVGGGQFEVALNGELTLHGVTRPQTISAKVSSTGTLLRAFGAFTVRQSEYGIKLVSVAGGTLKVKDELKCTFDITGRR
jgi:polyisoprenoid-binding protein YceI